MLENVRVLRVMIYGVKEEPSRLCLAVTSGSDIQLTNISIDNGKNHFI